MKSTIIVLLSILLPSCLFSQTQGQAFMDSLTRRIPFEKNDTIRVRSYVRAGLYYMDVNLDTAVSYIGKGMGLATRMRLEKGISAFHTLYGNIYYRKGQLDSALGEYQESLVHSIKAKDSVNMAGAYNNLGLVANAKSDYVAAAGYYTRTLDLGRALRNHYEQGVANENLSLVYQYQKNDSLALDYARASLAEYRRIGDETNYPSPLQLLGDIFFRMKKHDSAVFYYGLALGSATRVNDELKAGAVLNSIAELFAERKEYRQAIDTALAAKRIFDRIGPTYEDAITNQGLLGKYYLALANAAAPSQKSALLKQAGTYLGVALAGSERTQNQRASSEYRRSLAELAASAGDYRNAYLNLSRYQQLNDSIFSQENKNQIAALESRLAIQKKNEEIEHEKAAVRIQRTNVFLLMAGLLLAGATGFFFYRLSVIRRRKNQALVDLNRRLDEANRLKAKFFGILSHDLRSPIANLVNFLELRRIRPDALNVQQAADRERKIGDAAQSLLGTMEDMLLWSKSQMQQFRPTPGMVVIGDIFDYLRGLYGYQEGVEFRFFNEDDVRVETDVNYLKAITNNLSSNAFKALRKTPGGLVEWRAWEEGGRLCMSTTDNGPGIQKEVAERLYDDNSPIGVRQGMGLQIVRELARAIDCVISWEAPSGGGTRFVLRFGPAR